MSLRHHLCPILAIPGIGCAIAGMIASPNLAIPGFAMAGLAIPGSPSMAAAANCWWETLTLPSPTC